MKKYVVLIISLVLLSCQSDKKKDPLPNNDNISNEVVEIEKEVDENLIVLETKSGKSFTIEEKIKSQSLSNVLVKTVGFEVVNETQHLNDLDPLEEYYLADLNSDGFEELYLITRSVGSSSYEKVFGFSSNNDKSISPIYIAEMTEKDLESEGVFSGYMGHDSIYVDQNKLYRNFPIYLEGDPNCCPTGGDKTLEYELIPGEAAWQLKIKK